MNAKLMKWQSLLMIWLIAAVLAGCGGQSNGASSGASDAASSVTASGSELFESLGCIHCHQMNGRGPGPSLAGLYGENITLESGESVIVDEEYIRTSILDPSAQIHAGYQPMMPSFEGRVNDAELAALVEYIRSLGE